MRYLHTVSVQERAISADGVEVYDLAVNPLSVVLLALRPLNDTGTLSNFASYLNIAGAVNRVSILFRGQSIFSMSGRDAAALAYFRHGIVPLQANHDHTDNERRCVALPILLGRFAYDPTSCFPATRRGELTMEVDYDIADTGYDGMRVSVETIELLGAEPKEFERKVVVAQTFAATGANIVDLPVGNQVRGCLLFGTTGFAGASPAPSWGRIQAFLSNQQHHIGATDFEVAHMLSSLMGRQPPRFDAHTHLENTAGAYTQNSVTGSMVSNVGSGGWDNYAYLDFDPTRDDLFSIDTKNASRFHLEADAETADAVRAIPVERVMV